MKKPTQNLPTKTGVYIFHDKSDKIIYIGKALNLKKRVSSYFTNTSTRAAKSSLVKNIAKIEWRETESEIEALILESQLIKKHKPKYNISMRDDKNYFFVEITKEDFPRIYITHQPEKSTLSQTDIACRFGIFVDGKALKNTLRYLRNIFPYCTCRHTHKGKCLNAHIGRCPGFCCEKNQEKQNTNHKKQSESYEKNINSIIKILRGEKKALINSLRQDMKNEAQKQRFEKAAELRDKIESLEKIFAHKRIINRGIDIMARAKYSDNEKILRNMLKIETPIRRIEAYDIANIQGKSATASMVVFMNGKPDQKEYRRFKIKTVKNPNDVAMIRETIKRRLGHLKRGVPETLRKKYWTKPDLILVDGGKPQLKTVITEVKKSDINIPIIALAKKEEEIFIFNRKNPVILPKNSPILHLLQHLRDEAHRFARKYHHLLRDKEIVNTSYVNTICY